MMFSAAAAADDDDEEDVFMAEKEARRLRVPIGVGESVADDPSTDHFVNNPSFSYWWIIAIFCSLM